METKKCIYQRRSCRKFQNRLVDKSIQEDIIKAAQQAPSPKNSQPWKFKVITDRDKKEEIAQCLYKNIKKLSAKNPEREDLKMALYTVNVIKEVPMLVFVFLTTDSLNLHNDGVEWELEARDGECTYIMSIGAAIQNMLLRATEEGLGSLWMADIFYAYEELIKILNVDGNMVSAVAFGYSAEQEQIKKAVRKPLNEIMI